MKYFLRAVTEWKGGEYTTRTTGPQGSGILRSMAVANSLIELQENAKIVKKGDRVKVRAEGSTLARGMEPRASTAEFVSPGMPGALAAVKVRFL